MKMPEVDYNRGLLKFEYPPSRFRGTGKYGLYGKYLRNIKDLTL